MKRWVVPSLVLSLLALAGPAAAQITQRTQASPAAVAAPKENFVVTNEERGNYAVEFEKEAIDATLVDGSIPRIVVRATRGLGQLLRPRTHFVPELLKSVEIM
jgi:hypothetical protein